MNKAKVIEQAKELLKAAKDNPEQFQDLEKKYMGFKAVAASARASGARDPNAVAAAVGRKKYGKEKFQEAAAHHHKMGKTSEIGLSLAEKPAADGGQMSKEPMKKDAITDSMGMAEAPMNKDDKPHPPNSPEDKAHDVAEHTDCVPHAMKILDTPEKQKAMLAHLRTLHDPENMRSEKNREAGMTPDEKAKENKMDKAEIIKQAKALLELAKNEPQKFEELTKMSGVAGLSTSEKPMDKAAPAPAAPAAPKPAAVAPKAPAMPKMNMAAKPKMPMRMTKDEIKADLAKPWSPKHYKKGC